MIGIFIGVLLGMGSALMLCWWQSMKDNDDVTAIVAGSIGMAAISTGVILLLATLEVL